MHSARDCTATLRKGGLVLTLGGSSISHRLAIKANPSNCGYIMGTDAVGMWRKGVIVEQLFSILVLKCLRASR